MDAKAFFAAVIRQDAEQLRAFFWENAVIRWHCSNEAFTLEEYLRANCEYPNVWDGVIERMEEMGDTVILAARVFPVDGSASFHVVSFLRLREDRILSLEEYWAEDGEVPDWRRKMHLGRPIR